MPFQGPFPDEGKESIHWSHFEAVGGLTAYALSGVILTTFKGVGATWERGLLSSVIEIPDLPAGKGLVIQHWVPFVTLNSIANDDIAKDAGWAVDSFWLDGFAGLAATAVTLNCNLATRDIDGFVLRVGYHIDLVGTLGDTIKPK